MEFQFDKSIEILERTPKVLKSLLTGLSDEWIFCDEGDQTWSPYDVLGHLIHGEKTDWIVRTEIILSRADEKTFEPFDRFAQFEDSKGIPISDLLDRFSELRMRNLESIKSRHLTLQDLDKTGIHPVFGTVTLRQLLATWTAHDLGHLAQTSRVMAKQYRSEVGPWRAYLPIMDK